MADIIRAGIIGVTGYTGISLLEVLIRHPNVQLEFATTRQGNLSREYIHKEHPNLFKLTDLQFSLYDPENPSLPCNENVLNKARECDVVFLCTPSRASFKIVKDLYERTKIIDASSAFRLKDPEKYKETYGEDHPLPDLLPQFVYGLPELHRDEIKESSYVACPGCNATTMILAGYPLTKLDIGGFKIIYNLMVGSSEAGAEPTRASHHSERSGVVRPYSVKQHRHLAEVEQELGISSPRIGSSMFSVDMVRGIECIGNVTEINRKIKEEELWGAFRSAYPKEELFIRIRKRLGGPGSLPDVKYVRGSNYCDVGFFVDESSERVGVLSALDNLLKGDIGGNGVQAMNLMFGLDETTRLKDMVPSYLY